MCRIRARTLAERGRSSRAECSRRPGVRRCTPRPPALSPMDMTHHRARLERLDLEHCDLTDTDVFHLGSAVGGWSVTPRTPAGHPPITARVWLAAALSTAGRYQAPERAGHPASLRDGGPLVDSAILMAVIQRHFLRDRSPPGTTTRSASSRLDGRDLARAQRVLDAVQPSAARTPAAPALVGARRPLPIRVGPAVRPRPCAADGARTRRSRQVAHELVGELAVERDRVPVALVEVVAGPDDAFVTELVRRPGSHLR